MGKLSSFNLKGFLIHTFVTLQSYNMKLTRNCSMVDFFPVFLQKITPLCYRKNLKLTGQRWNTVQRQQGTLEHTRWISFHSQRDYQSIWNIWDMGKDGIASKWKSVSLFNFYLYRFRLVKKALILNKFYTSHELKLCRLLYWTKTNKPISVVNWNLKKWNLTSVRFC